LGATTHAEPACSEPLPMLLSNRINQKGKKFGHRVCWGSGGRKDFWRENEKPLANSTVKVTEFSCVICGSKSLNVCFGFLYCGNALSGRRGKRY
jgi:hypothetical protein